MPCDSVEECSVMFQLSMAKQPGDHRQSAHRERLIDERLWAVQSFNRRITGQWIFCPLHIGDIRIEFTDSTQTLRLSVIPVVRGLAKDVLTACGVVAKVEPLSKRFSVYV